MSSAPGRLACLLVLCLSAADATAAAAQSPDPDDGQPGHEAHDAGDRLDTLEDYRDPDSRHTRFVADPLDRALAPWDRFQKRLNDSYGLDFFVSYTALGQVSDQDRYVATANHQVDVAAVWHLVDSPRFGVGELRFWFQNLVTYGGVDTDKFSRGAGSAWGLNDADTHPDQATYKLHVAAWEQRLFGERLRLTAGQIDPTEYMDLNAFVGDASESFVSGAIGSNPVVPVLDRLGIGAYGSWTERLFYVSGLVMDADAKRSGGDAPSLFDWEMQYAGEVGWTPRVPRLGRTHVRFGLYYTEPTGSRAGEERGLAYSISADQELGHRVGALFRFSAASGNVDDLRSAGVAGLVLKEPLGFTDDEIGLAFLWGRPDDSKARDQYGLEVYWRLQITERIELSPDIQLLMPPASRSDDFRIIGGLRLRLVL